METDDDDDFDDAASYVTAVSQQIEAAPSEGVQKEVPTSPFKVPPPPPPPEQECHFASRDFRLSDPNYITTPDGNLMLKTEYEQKKEKATKAVPQPHEDDEDDDCVIVDITPPSHVATVKEEVPTTPAPEFYFEYRDFRLTNPDYMQTPDGNLMLRADYEKEQSQKAIEKTVDKDAVKATQQQEKDNAACPKKDVLPKKSKKPFFKMGSSTSKRRYSINYFALFCINFCSRVEHKHSPNRHGE